MRKARSDAKLLNLPMEQQEQLADWLLAGMPYHEARAKVEKDFGVTASIPLFGAFWESVCAPMLVRRRSKITQLATAITKEAAGDAEIDAALEKQLKQVALEALIQPNPDPDAVMCIVSQALKLRDQARQEKAEERKDKELQFAVEKFQFDAAKAAAKHASYIKSVSADKNLSENEKIQRIRQRLWGTPPPSTSSQ
jgi:hypothetical protein